jgi:hypothetical protein
VTGAAVAGLLAQLVLRIPVSPTVFSAVLTALLAVTTFFGMLRVNSQVLHGIGQSIGAMLPITLLRLLIGLVLVSSDVNTPLILLGLFLLLPPALVTPTLSLLWDGDYYTAVRQTVATSLVLPPMLLGALWLPGHANRFSAFGPALIGYFGVLIGAMFVPAVLAQVLRRRDPIRAGQLSTNWNWLGGLMLVPLAGFATFALTGRTGLTAVLNATEWPQVIGVAIAVCAVLLGTRLAMAAFLWLRGLEPRTARDVFITQTTPNIFLWFAIAVGVDPTADGYAALLAPTVACAFFAGMLGDEFFFVRQHTRRLRDAITATVVPVSGEIDVPNEATAPIPVTTVARSYFEFEDGSSKCP